MRLSYDQIFKTAEGCKAIPVHVEKGVFYLFVYGPCAASQFTRKWCYDLNGTFRGSHSSEIAESMRIVSLWDSNISEIRTLVDKANEGLKAYAQLLNQHKSEIEVSSHASADGWKMMTRSMVVMTSANKVRQLRIKPAIPTFDEFRIGEGWQVFIDHDCHNILHIGCQQMGAVRDVMYWLQQLSESAQSYSKIKFGTEKNLTMTSTRQGIKFTGGHKIYLLSWFDVDTLLTKLYTYCRKLDDYEEVHDA